MRIRSIKPFIWEDERLGSVTREARLLFIGLITLADDAGRFRATTSVLVGHIYPYDRDASRKVPKWLQELTKAGLVALYGGDQYGHLPGWGKHQRIHHPTASLLPEPLPNRSRIVSESFTNDSGVIQPRTRARVRGGGGGGGGGG
jgi:hypothetical protein